MASSTRSRVISSLVYLGRSSWLKLESIGGGRRKTTHATCTTGQQSDTTSQPVTRYSILPQDLLRHPVPGHESHTHPPSSFLLMDSCQPTHGQHPHNTFRPVGGRLGSRAHSPRVRCGEQVTATERLVDVQLLDAPHPLQRGEPSQRNLPHADSIKCQLMVIAASGFIYWPEG